MLNHPVKSLTVAGNHAGTHKATKAKGKGKNMADEQIVDNGKDVAEKAAAEVNATRTGKGTRVQVGATRGKGSVVISFEAFDESKPDTLPVSIEEFAALTGMSDEAALVSYLITGFNDFSYRKASDPIAEFINPAWPAEVQDSFKISVRNMVKSGAFTIESAVGVMRPAIDARFAS